MNPLSKSQVDKAGRPLRRMQTGDLTPTVSQVESAMEVLTAFRASHYAPLGKANNGLRSMLRTIGINGKVTQRLKRSRTILSKLVRQPTMALSNMQDIGGCRVVCSDIDDIRSLANRIREFRPPRSEYDYIQNPKQSGYRAIHLVMTCSGRLIEIQLRTVPMDEWATVQERVGAALDIDLKSGEGPPELIRLMRLVSKVIALEEDARSASPELAEQIGAARQRVLALLMKGVLED